LREWWYDLLATSEMELIQKLNESFQVEKAEMDIGKENVR
jgi:hypothetical protein